MAVWTNQRPVFRSRDQYSPIRGQYCRGGTEIISRKWDGQGSEISIVQSEASIQVTWHLSTNQRPVLPGEAASGDDWRVCEARGEEGSLWVQNKTFSHKFNKIQKLINIQQQCKKDSEGQKLVSFNPLLLNFSQAIKISRRFGRCSKMLFSVSTTNAFNLMRIAQSQFLMSRCCFCGCVENVFPLNNFSTN